MVLGVQASVNVENHPSGITGRMRRMSTSTDGIDCNDDTIRLQRHCSSQLECERCKLHASLLYCTVFDIPFVSYSFST